MGIRSVYLLGIPNGSKKGRPPLDPAKVATLKELKGKITKKAAALLVGCHVDTVTRYWK